MLRSLESVIKREDARLLYALATQLEDESWHAQIQAKIKRLPAKDISWHQVEAITLSQVWFDRSKSKLAHHGLQLVCPDVGIVILFPVSNMKKPGMVTLALGFVLQALQRLSVNSTPYRRNVFAQGYHHVMPEIVSGQYPALLSVHGINPSWRTVHELMARGYLSDKLPDMELELNDLDWNSTEMKLAAIAPTFDFWVGTHYLGVNGKSGVVSLHMLDVAAAVIRNLDYGQQTQAHLEASLWNEICVRYLSQDVLTKSLIRQLLPESEDVI
jgi:hypothetical protein